MRPHYKDFLNASTLRLTSKRRRGDAGGSGQGVQRPYCRETRRGNGQGGGREDGGRHHRERRRAREARSMPHQRRRPPRARGVGGARRPHRPCLAGATGRRRMRVRGPFEPFAIETLWRRERPQRAGVVRVRGPRTRGGRGRRRCGGRVRRHAELRCCHVQQQRVGFSATAPPPRRRWLQRCCSS